MPAGAAYNAAEVISAWAWEECRLQFEIENDRIVVHDADLDVTHDWISLRTQHGLRHAVLAPERGGSPAFKVECAIFQWPFFGWRMWVNVGDLYDVLNLKLVKKGTGATWFNKYLPRWTEIAAKCGLTLAAVRPSHQSNLAPADEEVRVLPFPSVSIVFLLMHSIRAAYCKAKASGRCENEDGRLAFERLAHGMLDCVPKDQGG